MLSAFFNESLASGQLPDEFKSGLLLPIFKSGKTDSQKADIYRGISLTCILSKVLERIVHWQLCDHFRSSGTFSDSQYGFRRNHSCSDLLVSTIDDWLLARDRKLNTAIVFLDLKWLSTTFVIKISCSVYRMQVFEVQFWDGYTTFSLTDIIKYSAQVHTQGTAIYASCPTKVFPRGAY